MAEDLNLKTEKLFLITVITSWSLEFKVTNPNTDIVSSFDSCSLVNTGKGFKLDETKTDILFEPVWQRKWKVQNQAVKLTFKAQALWLEVVCAVFWAIPHFIGKPPLQLAVQDSFLHAICSQVRHLRSIFLELKTISIFKVYGDASSSSTAVSSTVTQLNLKCEFELFKYFILSSLQGPTLLCM